MIVLLRWSGWDAEADAVVVHSVETSEETLVRRMEAIAKANPQYPLQKIGERDWRLGPEEDEGFFGHRPMWFRATEPKKASLK